MKDEHKMEAELMGELERLRRRPGELDASDIPDKRTEEELEQIVQKLRKALGATIRILQSLVENRDPTTVGHQRRVSQLACAIATEMGVSEEQTEAIRMAGSIHDLGKIFVPVEVLTKPGRLTESEFELVKTHPEVPYEVLSTVGFPWPVADIVLQHHERVNGSGYPQGLSGAEIMVEAAIIAVADVVEAMAVERPYRPAKGVDKALQEISQKRGILYDAKAVDACWVLFIEKGFEFE